jgi:hypothetical protein
MLSQKIFRSPLWLLLLILLAGSLPFIVQSLTPSQLPQTIGPAALVRSFSGELARSIVEQMHGKDVGKGENRIGYYRADNGSATLYITRFPAEQEAMEAGRTMTQRIAAGHPVFEAFRTMTFRQKPVTLCYGLGQMHFFFSEGKSVYWLATDTSCAAEMAGGLLQSVIH